MINKTCLKDKCWGLIIFVHQDRCVRDLFASEMAWKVKWKTVSDKSQ